ncbi:MAG: hypothetical protein Q9179_002360 [Wetmoreana sp. 5 TL-2023]
MAMGGCSSTGTNHTGLEGLHEWLEVRYTGSEERQGKDDFGQEHYAPSVEREIAGASGLAQENHPGQPNQGEIRQDIHHMVVCPEGGYVDTSVLKYLPGRR